MANSILDQIRELEDGMAALAEEEAAIRAERRRHSEAAAARLAAADAEFSRVSAALDAQTADAEAKFREETGAADDIDREAAQQQRRAFRDGMDAVGKQYGLIERRDREYIDDLNAKCVAAAKGNNRLLEKYGRFPANVTEKPDIPALYALFGRIMTDTAGSFLKKAMHKDGYYAQDAMVRDFISGAAAAICYLNYEITTLLPQDKQRAMSATARNAAGAQTAENARASGLRQAAETRRQTALQSVADARTNAERARQKVRITVREEEARSDETEAKKLAENARRRDAFFSGDAVRGFSAHAAAAAADTGALESDWQDYCGTRAPCSALQWGALSFTWRVPRAYSERLAKTDPAYFSAEGYRLPMLVGNRREQRAFLRYNAAGKERAHGHVQRFLLGKLRGNPAGSVRIFFADPNDRGRNLGPLGASEAENAAIGLTAANDPDAVRELLKRLLTEIDAMNGKLAGYASLYEHNAREKEKLPETVLVLCDVTDCLAAESVPYLRVIWENAARCGISVILTSRYAPDAMAEAYPNQRTDWSFLTANGKEKWISLYFADGGARWISGTGSVPLSTKPLGALHEAFLARYRAEAAESRRVENRFSLRAAEMRLSPQTEEEKRLGLGFSGVRLPVFIDTARNEICREFILGTENSQHMLVTGGTGSGKSRLLHSIIASIVMNYHPDDVELWLIDCKKVEFGLFLRMRPQHVRMVSLERSREFAFAFFDYLLDFAKERTQRMLRAGVSDLRDYRRRMNDPHCMPRVVIVMDEFHAITEHLAAEPRYRQLLEDALSEYRNLGISFIFSDQSVSGLKGLTEKSRQQIHCRVAMRGKITEMKETLEVLSDHYTPELLAQMENSEGRGDAWWNRRVSVRLKNVYLSAERDKNGSSEEEDFLRRAISSGVRAKQDTRVVLVNGNVRVPFDGARIRAAAPPAPSSLTVYAGVPTTLDDLFSFSLTRRYNQNLLLCGRDPAMAADIVLSAVLSARMCGVRVTVLAEASDERYRRFCALWGGTPPPGVRLLDGYDAICGAVGGLHDRIAAKQPLEEAELLVWLGLPELFDEFSVSGARPEKKAPARGFAVSEAALDDPELRAMAEGLGVSVAEAVSFLSGGAPESSAGGGVYDARADVLDLIAMGGKYGLFHLAALENAYDARRLHGFSAERFVHRIALCMPREESVEWGFRSAAAELTEGLTALYTDGITQATFKPYTHEKE